MATSLTISRFLVRAVAAGAMVFMPAWSVRAQSDDFITKVNDAFKAVKPDRRSDTILLPLLAKMSPPPSVMSSQSRAAMLGSEAPGWEECATWSQGEPQKAVLAVLPTITAETDHRKAYVFAQPYGVQGVDLDMVSEGLYTELGEPPTLAGAEFGCMPKLEQMGILVQVEASRLSAEGDPNAAIELLMRWVLFTRQFADRPFMKEKAWAMESMILGLERMRDVAYQDMKRGDGAKVDAAKVRERLELLPLKGYISLDRLQLPEGDLQAAHQLVNRVLAASPGDAGSSSRFGQTMAKITSTERPLRMFSNAAFWEGVRLGHRDHYSTDKMLTGVWRDWHNRWELSRFDIIQQTKSEYILKVQGRQQLAVIDQQLSQIGRLFDLRQIARVELAGTRMALAAYGYLRVQRSLPPALASAAPVIVRSVDKDPYTKDGRDLQYLRVGLDTPKGLNQEVQAYTIRVFMSPPAPSFQVPIPVGEFLLFSVGPDGASERVKNVTQGREGAPGDYLLWPPMLSLQRQRLIDTTGLN